MQAELLSTSPDIERRELVALLRRFRLRLGLERLFIHALRGAIASAIALIGISIGAWLLGTTVQALLTDRSWIIALPLLVGMAIAVVRWPSNRQTALVADRRLSLEERLGTALELAVQRGRGGVAQGRFAGLQIRDAIDRTVESSVGWLELDARSRREAILAIGVVALAAASLLLPNVPRPALATPSAEGLAPQDVGSALEDMQRTLPAELPELAVADAQPIAQAQADASLADRVESQQAERDALDQLAQALGRVSAGEPAADAIQRGDFSAAKQQLSSLGEEADQLSDAAKQQLAGALQQAAGTAAAADRQLADRERQAAQALSRNNYQDQRQALRSLGDQVERSGARSASADQLARDLGRLQQQAAADQSAGRAASPASAGQQGAAQNGAQAAVGQVGEGNQDGTAEQGGPGVGTGSKGEVVGNQPSRLDSVGQTVEVPTKLGAGPGVRPTDGTEDQMGADPNSAGRRVVELVQAQQTGQVAPEQNLVPGEQRPVVRGYFR